MRKFPNNPVSFSTMVSPDTRIILPFTEKQQRIPHKLVSTTANTWGTGTGTIKGSNVGLGYPVGAPLTPSPGSVITSYKQKRGLARDFSGSIGTPKAQSGIYQTGIVRWVHADMLNTFAGFVSAEANGNSTPAWNNLRGALIGFKQDGSNRDLVVRYRNGAGTSSDAVLLDNITMGEDYFIIVKMEQGFGLDKLWAQAYSSSDNYPMTEPTSWTVGGTAGLDADNLDEDNAPIKYLQIWGGDGAAASVAGGTGSQVDEMRLGVSWDDTLISPTTGVPQNFSLVPGKFGKSISLPGDAYAWTDSDKISLAKDMTLSVWTKIHDDDNGIIARNGQFSLQYEDRNTIIAYVRRGGTWTGARARSILGRWAHHAMTYDGNEVKLYLNGIEAASTPATGFLEWGDGADHKLYLGSFTGGGGWMAKVEMDDFRIYNKSLSASEISAIYNFGAGDAGVLPNFTGTSPVGSNPFPINAGFVKGPNTVSVSGFDALDLNTSNASLTTFTNAGSNSYVIDLNASSDPAMVRIAVPADAVDFNGTGNRPGAAEFHYRTVTAVEDDLLAWYTFDESNGTLVGDSSGREAPCHPFRRRSSRSGQIRQRHRHQRSTRRCLPSIPTKMRHQPPA